MSVLCAFYTVIFSYIWRNFGKTNTNRTYETLFSYPGGLVLCRMELGGFSVRYADLRLHLGYACRLGQRRDRPGSLRSRHEHPARDPFRHPCRRRDGIRSGQRTGADQIHYGSFENAVLHRARQPRRQVERERRQHFQPALGTFGLHLRCRRHPLYRNRFRPEHAHGHGAGAPRKPRVDGLAGARHSEGYAYRVHRPQSGGEEPLQLGPRVRHPQARQPRADHGRALAYEQFQDLRRHTGGHRPLVACQHAEVRRSRLQPRADRHPHGRCSHLQPSGRRSHGRKTLVHLQPLHCGRPQRAPVPSGLFHQPAVPQCRGSVAIPG